MITRTGVINDIHFPFSDSRLINRSAKGLILDIFEDCNLNRIVINGDLVDFYNLNTYQKNKHPDIQETLEDEIECASDFFNSLRKRFKTQEIIFNAGNHEYRLDRFIISEVPAFWNILRIENQLPLESNNIKFYPYNSKVRLENTNLYFQHSPPSYSENAAMASLKKKFDQSFMFGCTHRVDMAVKTGASGNYHQIYMNGWLGSTTETEAHRQVFSYVKGHENWQHAAAIIDVYNGDEFFVQQFMIHNYKTSINGVFYEG